MDYQSLALRTKSDHFFKDNVPPGYLMQTLLQVIAAAEQLDAIKKAYFYGRPLNDKIMQDYGGMKQEAGAGVPLDALHAAIGIITEGGELAESIFKTLFEGQEFDPVNFQEELGDVAWYRAVGLDAVGQTIEQNDTQNIDKLADRFGDKFDDYKALNRDLESERAVLSASSKD